MQRRKLWLGTTILRNRVRTSTGEDVGKIEDIVLDSTNERILYGVMSLEGYPELLVVPWSSFSTSPWPDYMLLNVDRKTLERAPTVDPAEWPNVSDPNWEDRIRHYYGMDPTPVRDRPIRDRTVYVERDGDRIVRRPARPMSAVGAALLVLVLVGLLWMTYLVSTRGWDGARREIAGSFSGAAYAMKEGTQDATLTAKVKTALSLSRRVPASQINVDSQGDVVTLRGEVDNDEIRNLAEQITKDTPGVREVHNHLYAKQRTQ
jgi:hypothetical protein